MPFQSGVKLPAIQSLASCLSTVDNALIAVITEPNHQHIVKFSHDEYLKLLIKLGGVFRLQIDDLIESEEVLVTLENLFK